MALAERANGVVINADASQVYRDLSILSARPDAADEARVPHRLFGYIDGATACSAAQWAADARAAIAEAHDEARLPILVGGTGLYLRTLIAGIAPVPDIDPAIRAEVRALPVAEAHIALSREDPAAAARLAPADTARVARALEVIRATGRTLADWQTQPSGGIGASIDLRSLILLPDRDELVARCDARLIAMFDGGAVNEVARLVARADVPLDAPVRRAIGVPEIAAMLAGAIDREQALREAQIATRRYAKRQYTWFRNQPPPDWRRVAEVSRDDLKEYFNIII
ncbi:tRNA (adenosine(37)-N6)-dimethylallyltransferase MiaA [uncultured Sphingomonas sp.]|uniref:tRNA (adenosine(37)-N6)-dimethylallyltransferase MiaA n=1 Tax=uncultured Sphingomonas sp. TaxID=158754 RepID=UPI0026259341|nr:tRNA (adenosine(37)-N6)-dimethylallyltransferase MiaA [uncultured Sphingomonas sp.]